MAVAADQQSPEPLIMAEDASEETLTSGLSLLVKVGNVLLETAKQDAEGRTGLEDGCSSSSRL